VHGLFSLWDWAVAWAFAILANWDFIFSSFSVRDAVLCFLFSLRLSYWRLVATPCCSLPILITTTHIITSQSANRTQNRVWKMVNPESEWWFTFFLIMRETKTSCS
jgi:hypothetical protein